MPTVLCSPCAGSCHREDSAARSEAGGEATRSGASAGAQEGIRCPHSHLRDAHSRQEEAVRIYEVPDLLPPKVARRKYPHRYANVYALRTDRRLHVAEPTAATSLSRRIISATHSTTSSVLLGAHLCRAYLRAWLSRSASSCRFLLRVFISVLDWSAFAVMMLSCGVTIICMHFGWFTDMPLSLLASGIIFPISFRCVASPALHLLTSLSFICFNIECSFLSVWIRHLSSSASSNPLTSPVVSATPHHAESECFSILPR